MRSSISRRNDKVPFTPTPGGRPQPLVSAAAPLLTGVTAILILHHLGTSTTSAQSESIVLPSWNDDPARRAIIGLVKAIADRVGARIVPPKARIVTFDHLGFTSAISRQVFAAFPSSGSIGDSSAGTPSTRKEFERLGRLELARDLAS
jgi:hypothetical protein